MGKAPRKYIDRSDRGVEIALARYGFELGDLDGSVKTEFTPEDLIIEILSKRPEPMYIRGIPIVLSKTQVDYDMLLKRALEEEIPEKLGYILSFAKKAFEEERITPPNNEGLVAVIEKLKLYIPKKEVLLNKNFQSESYRQSARETLRKLGLDCWKVLAKPDIDRTRENIRLYDGR